MRIWRPSSLYCSPSGNRLADSGSVLPPNMFGLASNGAGQQQHRPAEGLEGIHRGRPQGPEQASASTPSGRFRCTTSATCRASSSCTRCDCSRAPRPIASSGDGKAPAQGGGARFRIGFLDQTKVKSDAVRPRSATVTTPPRWANSCALPSPVT